MNRRRVFRNLRRTLWVTSEITGFGLVVYAAWLVEPVAGYGLAGLVLIGYANLRG